MHEREEMKAANTNQLKYDCDTCMERRKLMKKDTIGSWEKVLV